MTKKSPTEIPKNVDKFTYDALSAQAQLDALQKFEETEKEVLAATEKMAAEAEMKALMPSLAPELLRNIGSEQNPETLEQQAMMFQMIKELKEEIAQLKKVKKKNHQGGEAQYICHLGPITMKQKKDIVKMAVAEGKMVSLTGSWLALTEALDGMTLPPHVPLTSIAINPNDQYYKT